MIATAKIFKNGASQAVRLPKEFRFDSDEVCIKRVGSAVLLFPRSAAWDLMGQAIGNIGEDFMAERNQPRRASPRKTPGKRKGRRQ
jgi:antitoxin VapB